MRNLTLRLLACASVVIAGALVACASGTERTAAVEQERQAILRGAVESGYPEVGMLEFQTGRLGTGTLIAPNVVLTAAHVVGGSIKGFYTGQGLATTSNDLTSTAASDAMTMYPMLEKVTHPNYDAATSRFDVGLVRLAKPVQNARIRSFGPAPAVGTTCTAVGFGVHEGDGGNYDPDGGLVFKLKRSADLKVLNVTSALLLAEEVTGVPLHGDSGGPLFCADTLVGTVAYHTDGEGQDHHQENYMLTEASRAWIESKLLEWNGALPWPASGGGDDGGLDAAAPASDAQGVDAAVTAPSGASGGCQSAPQAPGSVAWVALPLLAAFLGRLRARRVVASRV